MKKVLCTILALTMLFAVCVMPTYADEGVGNVKLRVTATPMEEPVKGMESRTVYKVQVYLDSEKTLSALDVGLTFDSRVFDMLYNNNGSWRANTVTSNHFTSTLYDYENNMFILANGEGYGNKQVRTGHDTLSMLPADISGLKNYNLFDLRVSPKAKASSYGEVMVLTDEMEAEGKCGVYFHWNCRESSSSSKPDVLIGGHADASMGTYQFAGEREIFSFLIALKAEAKDNLPNGTHETTIGIDERQVTEIKGRYSTNNAPNVKDSAGFADFDSKTDKTVTCEAAKLQVKVEKPSALEVKKTQLRLTWKDHDNDGVPTVGAPAEFRVISKISNEDWNKYLFNTGKSTETNCITELGFIAYKSGSATDCSGYSLENFKKVVAGTTVSLYSIAKTDYIKHVDGQDAEFGAILKTSAPTAAANRDRLIKNVAYMAYYKFKDADGDVLTVMYNDVKEAPMKANWETLKEQYAAAYPNEA